MRYCVGVLVGLIVVVGLPLAGHWARRSLVPRCALDGTRIEPLYRVRMQDSAGASHEFCCIRCALLWLERGHNPQSIWVTDEVTGAEVDAGSACFVSSAIVTMPTTGNDVHAFGNPQDAAQHARVFRGALLTGADRPFVGSRARFE
jgi:hypothetical protein